MFQILLPMLPAKSVFQRSFYGQLAFPSHEREDHGDRRGVERAGGTGASGAAWAAGRRVVPAG